MNWRTDRSIRMRAAFAAAYILSQKCDVVLVGQILVHLRDPFAALEQAALCSSDYLVVAEGVFLSELPVAIFMGARVPYSWWMMSLETYREWLEIFGFGIVSASPGRYCCNVPGQVDSDIWTIVARRDVASVRPSLQRQRRSRGIRRFFSRGFWRWSR